MKVVCLVSGGKDSFYSLMECVKYGHQVVCLANLHPPKHNQELETDESYMYQQVGHEVIDAYSECLGVPLVRQEINGEAVNRQLQYIYNLNSKTTTKKLDEVEDLFNLIQKVQAKYPDIQAISSGAILSNYQRTRIENVYASSLSLSLFKSVKISNIYATITRNNKEHNDWD
jgi:diphthine-ammonia ligase